MRTYLSASLLAVATLLVPQSVLAQSYYARGQVEPRKQTTQTPSAPAAWISGDWGSYSSNCSSAAVRTRAVECRLNGGQGAPTSDSSCAGQRPESTQTTSILDGCQYSWDEGDWSPWSSTCSDTATHTRTIVCERSDGATVDDAACTGFGLTKPQASETEAKYTGCSYEWVKTASACSPSVPGYRNSTYQCQRSGGSVTSSYVTDSYSLTQCGSPPPASVIDSTCDSGNKLLNGNFETCSQSGWGGALMSIATGANAISGNCSAVLNRNFNSTDYTIRQNVAITAGATYRLTIKHRVPAGLSSAGVWIEFASGFNGDLAVETGAVRVKSTRFVVINSSTSAQTASVTISAAATSGMVKIENASGGPLTVDDVTFERAQ